jgi:hypothetical protein
LGCADLLTEPTLVPERVALPVQAVAARANEIKARGRNFITPL